MDNYSILSKAIGDTFEPQLDEFIDSVNFDVNAEFSEKFERKMDKLIRRRNKPYFNLICTGGRRAACIVAAIIILSASSLSVEAVREVVHDFFMSIFGDHTAVSVSINTEKDYPVTIEEEYAISNLPDGFELSDYNRDSGTIFAAYFYGDKYIFFEQFVMIVIWLILITNIPSLNTTLMNQDRNILFKVPTMISVFHGITANIFLKSQAI